METEGWLFVLVVEECSEGVLDEKKVGNEGRFYRRPSPWERAKKDYDNDRPVRAVGCWCGVSCVAKASDW